MKKVLIVEDDILLSGAYRIKLEEAGFVVDVAKNGQEGLMHLKNFMPDIIILDLIMPMLDGFSFIRKIKEDNFSKDIPIIVATNMDKDESGKRALEMGANASVIKNDITLDDLINKINELLQ